VPVNPQSEIANPKSVVQRLLAYRLLLGLAAVIFAADQLTKAWVAAHVPFNVLHSHGGGNDVPIIRGFFYLIHVGNTGAAWSMFSGRSVVLAVLAGATLVAMFFWRHTLGLRERMPQICCGLLCGGILGNLTDRLHHGYVVDFIDLHFGSYIYPTFNVADSAICIGVVLYIWQSLRAPQAPRSK
jgi:signal peptidase II